MTASLFMSQNSSQYSGLSQQYFCLDGLYRPLISKSSTPSTHPRKIVSSVPIIIGIIVTFMIHSFLCFLVRLTYLSYSSFFFGFTLWLDGTVRIFFLFLLIITRFGCLAEMR